MSAPWETARIEGPAWAVPSFFPKSPDDPNVVLVAIPLRCPDTVPVAALAQWLEQLVLEMHVRALHEHLSVKPPEDWIRVDWDWDGERMSATPRVRLPAKDEQEARRLRELNAWCQLDVLSAWQDWQRSHKVDLRTAACEALASRPWHPDRMPAWTAPSETLWKALAPLWVDPAVPKLVFALPTQATGEGFGKKWSAVLEELIACVHALRVQGSLTAARSAFPATLAQDYPAGVLVDTDYMGPNSPVRWVAQDVAGLQQRAQSSAQQSAQVFLRFPGAARILRADYDPWVDAIQAPWHTAELTGRASLQWAHDARLLGMRPWHHAAEVPDPMQVWGPELRAWYHDHELRQSLPIAPSTHPRVRL